MQANDINIDDETLQKYAKQYQNGLGIDYMKLWQRIETVHASSGRPIDRMYTRFTFRFFKLL